MDINLENWFKPNIEKKDLKELSRRRDGPGLFHFFIYGTIYTFSVCNWHETVHRTAFKTRWINEIFYHISSFMCDFEGFRWRWSHTFHHTYTLQTKDDYDYEIQISRPTDLIWFFINFLPFRPPRTHENQ